MTVSSKGAEYEEILELAVSTLQVTNSLPYEISQNGCLCCSIKDNGLLVRLDAFSDGRRRPLTNTHRPYKIS